MPKQVLFWVVSHGGPGAQTIYMGEVECNVIGDGIIGIDEVKRNAVILHKDLRASPRTLMLLSLKYYRRQSQESPFWCFVIDMIYRLYLYLSRVLGPHIC